MSEANQKPVVVEEIAYVDAGDGMGEALQQRFGIDNLELRVALKPLFLLMRKAGMTRLVINRAGNLIHTEAS